MRNGTVIGLLEPLAFADVANRLGDNAHCFSSAALMLLTLHAVLSLRRGLLAIVVILLLICLMLLLRVLLD